MNQIRAKMMLFHDPDKVSALIYLFIYLFIYLNLYLPLLYKSSRS